MNSEIILALIAVISGGGLTAIVNALIEHSKNKKDTKGREIDERIRVWQQISEKNELRMERLEQKLAICERDFHSLEHYILSLEQVIMFADPPLPLPPRPTLEREVKLE
jgi:TolA-binding protein